MKRFLLPAIVACALAVIAAPAPSRAATAPAILEWSSAIPGWQNAYYWYDTDGARYAFAPSAAFKSWFPSTPTDLENASIAELAPIPLKGVVPHRPGVRLIQFESSPKLYAVDRFGMLRWVTTEQVAFELYDANWKRLVDTLSVADYPLYRFGSPITDAAEFDPHAWDSLTSPATNVVNAQNHPPEKMTGSVTLSVNTTADFIVGEPVRFTAEVRGVAAGPNSVTIRIYDTRDQVIGTCKQTAVCQLDVTPGGPVGDQRFIARAFNAYGQAIASEPILRFVKNP